MPLNPDTSSAQLVLLNADGSWSGISQRQLKHVPDFSLLACITNEVIALLPRAVETLRLRGQEHADSVVILVPEREAPIGRVRDDGVVVSFVTPAFLLKNLDGVAGVEIDELCYLLLHHLLSFGDRAHSVDIQHIGRAVDLRHTPEATVEIVIPHRGDAAHLQACLAGLAQQSLPFEASICLDQEPAPDLVRWIGSRFPMIKLYAVEPCPAGPYVIRQYLSMRSRADYIVFQDSDDVPIFNRIEALLGTLFATGADFVGSHELRVDELERRVYALRFPLDASAAIEHGARHPILFPTLLVRRSAMQRLGGFSTTRRFASDTEFILRAHCLGVVSANADRFLYLRRRRAGSLTTAAETGLRSEARNLLDKQWRADFLRIREDPSIIQDTSLAVLHSAQAYKFFNLITQECETVTFGRLTETGGV